MQYIPYNTSFTAVLRIPESASGDTVTYVIYKASDGSTFASGNATYVAGNNWKVAFTPTTLDELYILELNDSTLDAKVSEQYKAISSLPLPPEPVSGTDTQSLLTAVNNAILAVLNGGAVQSYSIGGRNLQRYSLKELRDLKAELLAQLAAETSGGTTNYADFEDPS